MKTEKNLISSPRGLQIEPLRETQYNIFSVTIAKELDEYNRRLAIATVVVKDKAGIWDGNTMHHIELKHCYSWASKGPYYTPYEELTSKILTISSIEERNFSDCHKVVWYLTSPSLVHYDKDYYQIPKLLNFPNVNEQVTKEYEGLDEIYFEEDTPHEELLLDELTPDDVEVTVENLLLDEIEELLKNTITFQDEEDMILWDQQMEDADNFTDIETSNSDL